MAYTLEEKQNALREVVRLGGDLTKAERETGVTRKTLRGWREEMQEFYNRVATDYAAEVESREVVKIRENLSAANDVEAEVLRQLQEKIEEADLSPAALSQILQRVAVVKGINADKLLKVTGRPAALPSGDIQDLLTSLQKKGVIEAVETPTTPFVELPSGDS